MPAILSTNVEALEWLDDHVPDVVLLDLELRDGSSAKVAEWLVRRAVPFVVFSGTSVHEFGDDPVFMAGGWLEKPASGAKIVEALKSALGEFANRIQAAN